MKMKKEAFISMFAKRDALLRSTTTISTLFTVSVIALVPSLGPKGVAIAISSQMIASAFFEIPISLWADTFGRPKVLLLGLLTKLFVSLSFAVTIWSAWKGVTWLLWASLFAKSVLNSISNSMLNGSFQVAYLNRYLAETEPDSKDDNDRNPLFIASFRHAMGSRLILPLSFALGLAVIFSTFEKSEGSLYLSALLFVGAIIALRIFSLVLITRDFKNPVSTLQKKSQGPMPRKSKFMSEVKSLSAGIREQIVPFLNYSGCSLINLIVSYYLSGRMYRSMGVQFSEHGHYIWLLTLLVGIVLYSTRTLVVYFLVPRFKSNYVLKSWIFPFGAFLSSGSFFLLGFVERPVLIATIAFGGSILFHCLTDLVQKNTESRLGHLVKGNLKVTWVGLANSMAYFVFAVICWVVGSLPKSSAGDFLVGFVIATLALLSAGFYFKGKDVKAQQLRDPTVEKAL